MAGQTDCVHESKCGLANVEIKCNMMSQLLYSRPWMMKTYVPNTTLSTFCHHFYETVCLHPISVSLFYTRQGSYIYCKSPALVCFTKCNSICYSSARWPFRSKFCYKYEVIFFPVSYTDNFNVICTLTNHAADTRTQITFLTNTNG